MRGTRWAIGLVAVVAGVAGLSGADDDTTYDLRGPAPKKGQAFVSKSVLRIKNADLTVKTGGQTLKLKQTMVITSEEDEKFLVVEGRQVTKSQVRIVKDQVEITADFMGMSNTEKQANDLEGETVISERTGEGKWKHTLVDASPTDKQKKELDKRIGPESDDPLYPAEKVKVGHAWTVDAAELKRFFGNSFTDIKGKVKQKFLKVEDVDGAPCAVIESSGPIKAKMKDDEGQPNLDVELDLKITSWRDVKTAVDVKSKFEGKIRIAGKQKMDGVEAELTIDGPFTGDGTTKMK